MSSPAFVTTMRPTDPLEGAISTETKLQVVDFVVIVGYFICVIGVGIWSSRRSKGDSVSGYFLASRSMHFIPVGASLFASNIGSGHFIGLAGSGASSGIAIAGFELNAIYILMVLGWVFVPVYMSAMVYTMPEYLKMRFGGNRIRVYLAVLALLLSIFTKISADLYAGAIFIKQSLDWNLYASVGLLLAISCTFTIAGGLTAVIWTDFAQTILMLGGAFYLMILSLSKVGGYTKLFQDFYTVLPNISVVAFNNATNESCSKVTEHYNHLLRPATDPDLPWTGMVFGLTVSAIWYWCSDQVIVQRALSAKNLSHAKAGCVMAAILKLSPLYLLVLPGMAARVLFPDKVGCSRPESCLEICGSASGCSNIAYPLLVLNLMPPGATGLMLSVMMAALMSSLTSIFNSSSTIFTIDIWTRIRKDCTEIEQVVVGRVFVIFLVIVSIIWIPIIEAAQGSQLFHYIQSVTSYLAPPVCSVYLLAVLWERINEKGAFWGLMVGLVVGMIRFIVEFSYTSPSCESGLPDPRPAIITQVHYLHFGVILFFIVSVTTIVISLATEPIDPIQLYRLTFWTRFSDKVRVDIEHQKNDSETEEYERGVYNLAFNEAIAQNIGPVSETTLGGNSRGVHVHVQPLDDHQVQSPFTKWLYFVCCVSKESNTVQEYELEAKSEPKVDKVLNKEAEARLASTYAREEPQWARIINISAILLIGFTSFFWGLYA